MNIPIGITPTILSHPFFPILASNSPPSLFVDVRIILYYLLYGYHKTTMFLFTDLFRSESTTFFLVNILFVIYFFGYFVYQIFQYFKYRRTKSGFHSFITDLQ